MINNYAFRNSTKGSIKKNTKTSIEELHNVFGDEGVIGWVRGEGA